MEYDDFGRPKKPTPMVPIDKPAGRLGISLETLLDRLASQSTAVVGRGKRARITEADMEHLNTPVVPIAEAIREPASERSAGRLLSPRPSGIVVPFRPKPKRCRPASRTAPL